MRPTYPRRARRSRLRREDGNTLVEMALVLPLLVVLVFGIVEFGRAYNAQVTLTHAAREGVRVLALTGDGGEAADAARNAATSLSPGQLSVSTSDCDPGEPAELTITYPFSFEVPLIGTDTMTLTGTGVMRCGG